MCIYLLYANMTNKQTKQIRYDACVIRAWYDNSQPKTCIYQAYKQKMQYNLYTPHTVPPVNKVSTPLWLAGCRRLDILDVTTNKVSVRRDWYGMAHPDPNNTVALRWYSHSITFYYHWLSICSHEGWFHNEIRHYLYVDKMGTSYFLEHIVVVIVKVNLVSNFCTAQVALWAIS